MNALLQGLNDAHLQHSISQTPIGDPRRKGPQREGSNIFDIARGRALLAQSQEHTENEIEELRASYVFADESVARFLSEHRAFSAVLRSAIRPLKATFGADKVVRLEVSKDEDELRTFYVVVRWDGAPDEAAAAIDRFDDNWWLEHITPAVSSLSFTYDLA